MMVSLCSQAQGFASILRDVADRLEREGLDNGSITTEESVTTGPGKFLRHYDTVRIELEIPIVKKKKAPRKKR